MRSRRGWKAARRALRAGPCPYCGTLMDPDLPRGHPRKAVLDHVIPLAARPGQGYHHTIGCCNLCNLKKAARPLAQHRATPPHQSRRW